MTNTKWKVTTSPYAEPVTLEEAKTQLRVIHDDEDDAIEAAITDARDWCERYLDLAIVEQTITLKLDAWPEKSYIELPFSNLLSVNHVKYLDSDRAEQTVATTVYGADTFGTPGRIYLKAEQEWPANDLLDEENCIEIEYQAGFAEYVTGDVNVPGSVKRAILLLLSHWFENREGSIAGISIAELPLGVTASLDRHRKMGL